MAETPELQNLAAAAAAAAGLPENLFFGLIKTESGWNPSARSGAGALGLTQVMPWWITNAAAAASIGMSGKTPQDLLDNPALSLTAGARILASELDYFGAPELALMAYNAGRTAVNAAIKAAGSRDPATVSASLKAAETRAYWQKVMNWANYYSNEISEATATVENVATDTVETVKELANPGPLLIGLVALAGIFFASRK
jgi:soluble lytic murein transglycosylase-like protein